MTSHAIKIICFDLGGVIIRICRSWQEGCARAGLKSHDNRHELHTPNEEWKRLHHQLQIGAIDSRGYANRLSDCMQGAYAPDEIARVHASWLLGEYEGVDAVIDQIHAAGLRSACLSNTDHLHWEQMQSLPAFAKLQQKCASHLFRLQKPDPAIYRAFQQHVSVKADSILFFDDLPENIEAAQCEGWNAIQVNPHIRTDQQIMAGLRSFGVAL